MPEVLLSAADLIIGAGVFSTIGYLYRIERNNARRWAGLTGKIRGLAVRVDCLQALHLERHPEDRELLDRICRSSMATAKSED
jgi:hypothetical protein